ncbi:hypothetical protein [Streptosporangium amethystogenes]|uniref:hypothetical protein n=1 Tax=Streptosporangium amethystogenes TaxID=2002 RepID=UPI0004CA1009|nr:hypothetical protein [Streptosporangium amethystogenes]
MGAAALVVGAFAVSGVWSSGETAQRGEVARVPVFGGPPTVAPQGDPVAGAVVAAELDGKGKEDTKSSKVEKKRQRAGEAKASGPSKHTDKEALAYFESRKATKRVRDIRMVGGYLRIYTDLPESADNSKQAIKLCEAGVDYLVGELGMPSPVVFVQAEFGENGNPVLANVLGPDDPDCRVTYPKPRR